MIKEIKKICLLLNCIYFSLSVGWKLEDASIGSYNHCTALDGGALACYEPKKDTVSSNIHPFYLAYLAKIENGHQNSGGQYASAVCNGISLQKSSLNYEKYIHNLSSSSGVSMKPTALFLLQNAQDCGGPGLGNHLSDYYELVAFGARYAMHSAARSLGSSHSSNNHHHHQQQQQQQQQQQRQRPTLHRPIATHHHQHCPYASILQQLPVLYIPANLSSSFDASNCQRIYPSYAWEAATAYQWRCTTPLHASVSMYMHRLAITAHAATVPAVSDFTVAIHVRCSDNLPFGLLPRSFYQTILQEILTPSSSLLKQQQAAHIIRISVYTDVGLEHLSSSSSSSSQSGGICPAYLLHLNDSLHQLVATTMANVSPRSSFSVELRHGSILQDYLHLHTTNVTICSISTFCTSAIYGRRQQTAKQQSTQQQPTWYATYLPIPPKDPKEAAGTNQANSLQVDEQSPPKPPPRVEHMQSPFKIVLGYQTAFHPTMKLVRTPIIKLNTNSGPPIDVKVALQKLGW